MQPSDLASTHAQTLENVRCIDCHSTAGISGRINSLSQGASDLIAYISGNYQQPAITHHPIGNQACTKCHTPLGTGNLQPQNNLITSNSHYHIASYLDEWKARTANPIGTCSLCHVSHSDYTEGDDAYSEIATNRMACDECHRTLSGWIPPN